MHQEVKKNCPTFSAFPFAVRSNQIMLDIWRRKRKENWVKFRRKFSGWQKRFNVTQFPSHTTEKHWRHLAGMKAGLLLCNRNAVLLWKFSQGEFFLLFRLLRLSLSLLQYRNPYIFIHATHPRAAFIKTLSFSLWCSSVLLISGKANFGVDTLLCRFYCFKFEIEICWEIFDKQEIW